jgi:hypothetical protein
VIDDGQRTVTVYLDDDAAWSLLDAPIGWANPGLVNKALREMGYSNQQATEVWRCDYWAEEYPTLETITTHAEDQVGTNGDYTFYVNHIQWCQGHAVVKGFKPIVKAPWLDSYTGPVVLGTNRAAWDDAVARCRQIMAADKQEYQRVLAESERNTAEHAARSPELGDS